MNHKDIYETGQGILHIKKKKKKNKKIKTY